MELRLTLCMAFFVLALSEYTEAHSVHRRQAVDDANYDDPFVADEAVEYDTQNDDTDNNDTEKQPMKPPATISTLPTTYESETGKAIELHCEVSPENETVVFWYKNNVMIMMGNNRLGGSTRYSIVPYSKNLMINITELSDAGEFKCEVYQKVPVSVKHTVIILEKPKVFNMSATNDGQVGEDSDVSLSCAVTGGPTPQVMWSFTKQDDTLNVRVTEKDGEFSVNGTVYTLQMKRIRVDQAGKYFCYAINKVGSGQGDIVIKVIAKPRVHVPKTVVNSDIQVEAVLQCSVHETPKPHIRWYKDGILIEDSSSQFIVSTQGIHSNLTVTPTADEDFGTFTCEGENVYGKHNKSIELVQRPVVEEISVDGPKMSWIVHSHQPLEEMELHLRDYAGKGDWKKLSVPLPQGNGHIYDVKYVVEGTGISAGKYEAIVKVKNNKSWGSSSDSAIVEIVEDVQPEYIQHASVFRTNGAHSIRPMAVVAPTFLMYLLVRML